MQVKKIALFFCTKFCAKTSELNPVVDYLVDSFGLHLHSKTALVAK